MQRLTSATITLIAFAACATWTGGASAEETARPDVSISTRGGDTCGGSRRAFGAKAPWNVPVGRLSRRSDSDYWAELLWRKAPDRAGNFNLGFTTYTYPVYCADAATGLYPIRTKWQTDLDGKTIPWNPAWRPAPGRDAQVIILDAATGREWDLFRVKFDGSVVKATNANLVPGDYRKSTASFPPSRGVGIPYLAMLVRPEEIAAGRIDHALSMPIKNPDGSFFVAPASKLERETSRKGIPLGMRFALDVSEEEIQAWASRLNVPKQTRRSAIIIARALRDYGWFVTDTSGGATFQFEADVSAGDEWAALGLSARNSGGRRLPADLMDGLLTRDRIYAVVASDKYPPQLRRPGG